MIFITLGSQKFQFDRLLKEIDTLVANDMLRDKLFAQTGYSEYKPQHYPWKSFLNRDEFISMVEQADLVITHGGTGAIINAIKKGKKVVAVPRLAKYGEHIDDHQLQIVTQFSQMNLINSCVHLDRLLDAINTAYSHQYETYCSNTDAIINSIEDFIHEYRK